MMEQDSFSQAEKSLTIEMIFLLVESFGDKRNYVQDQAWGAFKRMLLL